MPTPGSSAGLKSAWPTPRIEAASDGPNAAPCGLSVTFGACAAICAKLVWLARFEHRGVDRGDRERRVLQVLLAELRGDDDLVAGRLVSVLAAVRVGLWPGSAVGRVPDGVWRGRRYPGAKAGVASPMRDNARLSTSGQARAEARRRMKP